MKKDKICRGLIYSSLLLNFLLSGLIIFVEEKNHYFGMGLERRNIILLDGKNLPDICAREGWENTIKKLHMEFDVAFFGNSITKGSDFQKLFPDKKIINLGYGGDNIHGMIRRIPMLQAANPKKIFIMAGTNDIFHISIDDYTELYETMLNAISDSIPSAKIYIQSILPMNQDLESDSPSDKIIKQANKRVLEIAKKRNYQFVDVYQCYVKDGKLPEEVTPDGIHPYSNCYDSWAHVIEKYIYE